MADSYAALAKTTTATTGTLDYVLATVALTTAHRTPKQAVADGSLTDGDIVQYMVRDTTVTGDASFELGEGVYTDSTNEIARDAANVHDGSNGPGALTVWPGSGTRDIYLVVSPSNQLARLDRANTFTVDPQLVEDSSVNGIASFGVKNDVQEWRMQVSGTDGDRFRLRDQTNSLTPFRMDPLSPTNSLFINTTGVGIGVVSVPSTNLHVQESNTETVPAVEIEQLSTGDAALQFSIVGDAMAIGFDNSDVDSFKFSYAAAAGTAVLGTNDRIIIDSSGKVSIGPVAPSTQLHVHDTTGLNEIRIQSTAVNSICSLGLRNDTRLYRLQIDGLSSDNFQIVDDTSSTIPFVIEAAAPSDSIRIDASGNIGFGKTPSSKLDINLSTEDLEIVDAGSASATEQDWIEVQVGGNTGFIRVFAAK